MGSIILYDTDLYTYDAANVDYEGVVDTVAELLTDHTFIGEIQLLSEDEAGPSSAIRLLQWARAGVHFICDDVTDSVLIEVSNNGTDFVTRSTMTGPGIDKISGGWKYIKATRVTGNGSVILACSKDLYQF